MLLPLAFIFSLATIGQAIHIKDQTCSPSEETKLFTAIGKASHCLDTVLQIHDGTLPFSHALELRERYFGNITSADFRNVTETLTRVQNSWSEKTFICAKAGTPTGDHCAKSPAMDANANIVVVTNGDEIRVQATEINICPSFLDESHDGYGDDAASRIPVLIHEMTHAAAEPGTLDVAMPGGDSKIAYGEKAAQQLAFWSPELAARNADNFSLYSQAVCAAASAGEILCAEDIDRSVPDEELADAIEERVFQTSPEQIRATELRGANGRCLWPKVSSWLVKQEAKLMERRLSPQKPTFIARRALRYRTARREEHLQISAGGKSPKAFAIESPMPFIYRLSFVLKVTVLTKRSASAQNLATASGRVCENRFRLELGRSRYMLLRSISIETSSFQHSSFPSFSLDWVEDCSISENSIGPKSDVSVERPSGHFSRDESKFLLLASLPSFQKVPSFPHLHLCSNNGIYRGSRQYQGNLTTDQS